MATKKQSARLTNQQKARHGQVGIFCQQAQLHDKTVAEVSLRVKTFLEEKYPNLTFDYWKSIEKAKINAALKKVDARLGSTLFVANASIKPDGGIIVVRDDAGEWRVILVAEAKHQGKDKENIERGKLVGANNAQDIMAAGNAIERAHKNIAEMANFMLAEEHFPYVLFLEGTNFLTETITVTRPDGRTITLEYNSGELNRLDRLTAANYGLPINQNLCKNIFVTPNDKTLMLQAASIYTQGDGTSWNKGDMFAIMLEIAEASLQMLGSELFKQLTNK